MDYVGPSLNPFLRQLVLDNSNKNPVAIQGKLSGQSNEKLLAELKTIKLPWGILKLLLRF